ncbi:hypothetical protein [Lacinutrix sp. Bg11-31]|uniref:hypothetical protein n=1 Tax=Lacinutrix sp. Bg11-31 TaxID=2057808 RepID=UPI000C315FA7|nr:hypothetical protein [Lacinutrix sp. Bg11-31]AUC80893.1 hypothetical protein CW733_01570 [Lacinutrix sp. Bg11-31]
MEKDYSHIKLPANGKWQTLIGPISGLITFEIIAYAKGKETEGKYAVLHSIATNAFGSGKLNNTKTNYGDRSNRLSLKWIQNKEKKLFYSLQIKTNRNYGNEEIIFIKMKELLNIQPYQD